MHQAMTIRPPGGRTMKRYEVMTAIGLATAALSGCGGGGYGGGSGGGGYMNLSSAAGPAALGADVQANHAAAQHATDTGGTRSAPPYATAASPNHPAVT